MHPLTELVLQAASALVRSRLRAVPERTAVWLGHEGSDLNISSASAGLCAGVCLPPVCVHVTPHLRPSSLLRVTFPLRYKELPAEGQAPIVGSLYVQKWFAGNTNNLEGYRQLNSTELLESAHEYIQMPPIPTRHPQQPLANTYSYPSRPL